MTYIGRKAAIAVPVERMADYCANGAKSDGSDRLTKQTFELRRKSGWSVNPQEQVTNLGEQFANFIVCEFCYVPANA